ncbi:hypothetical protein A8924_7175 [Saccharopolyspora erythraea NRRL 2338]|uniref:Uncharacterized protein n=2 Tax=Saccharopolyspora erythraea TaxID=1836 RepID=A4FPK5_SACEN|nr:hypothetical protein [Saccharopolyspora erythraea]PFG99625.1 hypothetical protein A8924_7175 [Saccharopolyspora erythraea NRRL 2338]CAM05980.1 hypothetical protein SACE_6816 [Saccharopolyspora erythraea NRRL 2338]
MRHRRTGRAALAAAAVLAATISGTATGVAAPTGGAAAGSAAEAGQPGSAGTAAAPSATGQAGSAQAAPGQHCSYDLRTAERHCFASQDQAVTAARARSGEVIQATLFDNRDYGGASFTVYGESLCKKDGVVNYQLDLPDDWKNRVSSVQPWGNCWIWLYPEPGLGGDRDGPFDENTPHVGDLMDDRTQSIGLS